MKKQYEILLFDADGTLLDFDRAEEEAFKQVLEKYGFPPEKRYVDEYHRINRECWEAFEEGRMERNDVLTVRFERFFAGHDREIDGREAENCYRALLGNGAYLIDGALEILEELKRRYDLYIVTNGVADTQRKRLADSGLAPYFKDVFISEDAGSQKPQREFFEYCFSRIPDARPERMLIIGDSLTSDMQGGVNAGIDTCWLNPGFEKNKRNLSLTWEIRDLKELRNFV